LLKQSVVRRFIAKQRFHKLLPQYRIQLKKERVQLEHKSAVKIQSVWRGFWHFSQYVICQFEVARIQAAVRGYLTRQRMLDYQACALIIQCTFRQYRARRFILYTRVLKVWAKSKEMGFTSRVCATKIQRWARQFIQVRREYEAALVIQNFFIMLEERKLYWNACTLMIQCAYRQFYARRKVHMTRVINLLTGSKQIAFRTKVCVRKIQREFRRMRKYRKEKAAALIIERFFIMIKVEIDREIRRQQKKVRKRKKKKEAEEKLLEKVWLNTMSEDDEKSLVPMFKPMMSFQDHNPSKQNDHNRTNPKKRDQIQNRYQPTQHTHKMPNNNRHTLSSKNSRTGRNYSRGRGNTEYVDYGRPQNVTHNEGAYSSLNQRYHENYIPPTDHVAMQGDTHSEVSGITSPSVFYPRQNSAYGAPSRYNTLRGKDLSDDYSLEEAWIDTEIHSVKERHRDDLQYAQRYGHNNNPNSYYEAPMSTNGQRYMTSNDPRRDSSRRGQHYLPSQRIGHASRAHSYDDRRTPRISRSRGKSHLENIYESPSNQHYSPSRRRR